MNGFWISLIGYYLVSLFYLYSLTFNFRFLQPNSLFSEIIIAFTPLVLCLLFLYQIFRHFRRGRGWSFELINALAYLSGYVLVYAAVLITSSYEKGFFTNVGTILILVSTLVCSGYLLVRVYRALHLNLASLFKLRRPLVLFILGLILLFQLAVIYLYLTSKVFPSLPR